MAARDFAQEREHALGFAERTLLVGYAFPNAEHSYLRRAQAFVAIVREPWRKTLCQGPSSFVEGMGVFARLKLYAGECIGEYPGERLTRDAANEQGDHVYLFDVEDGDVIDGRPGLGFADENPLRFLNNRCQRPNVYAESIFLSETWASIFFFAAHDIDAGEELTLTYGENYVLPNCLCQDCRPT